MTYQRMYQPKVKTGNWFEDLLIKEDTIKEFLNKRGRGELLSQKVDFLKQNILKPVNLSATINGQLHFGDVVMLVNVGGADREHSALSINANIDNLVKTSPPSIKIPCGVSGGRGIQSCVRTAFIITSVDGSPEGSTLHFDQSFALRTTSGFAKGLYLTSDKPRFIKCAKKSGLQDVYLDETLSILSRWKISHFDPQERFESEGLPVPANEKVLVVHCMTNQGLAVLSEKQLWWWFYSAGENPAFTTAASSHTKKNSTDTGPFGDTCRAYRETVDNVKDILVNSRSRTWPRAELCNNHRVNSDIFDLTSGHLSLHKYVSLP